MRKRIGYLVVLIGMLILMMCGCEKESSHTTHEYGDWHIVKAVTCTEDGERERICSCGKKETEVIKATGHVEVKDNAVAATCTSAGKTEGSHCSVCQTVIKEQKTIKPQHKEYILNAVAVTCTRAGKGKGVRCSECGAVIERQKKIRANGHKYVDGKCTICGEEQPDIAAAIIIDQLNEEKESNFITKKAYPGGSTVEFYAYVPKGVSWWAVSWTTNSKNIGLYDWAEGNGSLMQVETGKWQKCTVALPTDKKNYYIYIVGAKGEWKNEELLIDDVVIKNSKGKVLGKDTFQNGIENLFHVVKTNPSTGHAVVYEKEVCSKHVTVKDKAVKAKCDKAGLTEGTHCKNCGKILVEQKEIPATGHVWKNGKCKKCGKKKENLVAALVVDQLNDSVPMNFITKKAYPGGSTVTFKAYIPKNVTGWAAISWTTDKSKASLYDWGENGQQIKASAGEWTDCAVTLPNDGKKYYIYFVAEKGQYKGKELLLDAVKITDAKGKVIAEDDFDNGVENGIFDIIATNPTSGALVVYDKTAEDPCKNGHKIVMDKAVKPTCTKPGKTAGKHCKVCDTVLVEQEEIPALGHDYNDKGICKVCGDKIANRAVSIDIDQLNESNNMNFITRKAYAGGSTVTLRAYVPSGTGWWAISWTTNPTDADLYKWTDGKGASQSSVYNKWTTYTITLPDDENNYYIYIVGAKGEWNGKKLQIDDVKITDKTGQILGEDNFNSGMYSGIFKIIDTNPTTGMTVVSENKVGEICLHKNLVSEENIEETCTEPGRIGRTYCKDCGETIHEETIIPAKGHHYDENGMCECGESLSKINKAVSIKIGYINEYQSEGKMNFITKKAYKGGSTVTFKAYVPQGASWANIYWTTSDTKGDIYGSDTAGQKSLNGPAGEWTEYSLTLPEGEDAYYLYFGGAKGEWGDKELLIDDFKVQTGETTEEDNFNNGLESGLFNAIDKKNDTTIISLVTVKEADKAASIMISQINEHQGEGKMNFITKKAYKGGSTVTFKAYVPQGASWANIYWTTSDTKGDIYGSDTAGQKSLNGPAGEWTEYSLTLPEGEETYYLYFGGAKGEWGDKELLISDFKVQTDEGLEEDYFTNGLDGGLFNVIEKNPSNDREVVSIKDIK